MFASQRRNGKDVTHRLHWHSWAQVWGGKGGGGRWWEMYGDVSPPKPNHVGPDRMGTGAVSWGVRVRESQGGDSGFEEIWAEATLVTQQIHAGRREVNYEVSNCVTEWTFNTQTSKVWLTHIYISVRVYLCSSPETQPQCDLFSSVLCNIHLEDLSFGYRTAEIVPYFAFG